MQFSLTPEQRLTLATELRADQAIEASRARLTQASSATFRTTIGLALVSIGRRLAEPAESSPQPARSR